ncbi:MAG TPA: hypothetical protein VGJ30_04765, partial [Candidatus Angelobacter sp.]
MTSIEKWRSGNPNIWIAYFSSSQSQASGSRLTAEYCSFRKSRARPSSIPPAEFVNFRPLQRAQEIDQVLLIGETQGG